VKNIRFIDRIGLFKISNLVLGGKEIVMSLFSSLERQKERERERENQQEACRGL
jgi:hypothetical protein